MQLNQSNYYSQEAAAQYVSSSQYFRFKQCESAAVAEIAGLYRPEKTTAMLQGGYVDAHVEGTLDRFIENHPEMISSRGPTAGNLKAEYRFLDDLINRFERDELFASYLVGEKQVILTGEIGGVPVKGKLDVLHPERIVDVKTVRDFELIWDASAGQRVTFLEAWGYLEQGAIYQELVRQQFGQVRPFYVAAVTKETVPDIAVIHVPDDILTEKLDEVKYYIGRIQAIKTGLVEPIRCERCDWCKQTKVLTGPVDYRELI